MGEEVDEVLAGLFDAEGDGLAVGEGVLEVLDPGLEGLGRGADLVLEEDVSGRVEVAGVEGLVGSVDADEGVVFHDF